MINSQKQTLSEAEKVVLLETLHARFTDNKHRHQQMDWQVVVNKLEQNDDKLLSLYWMEETGGEPDLVTIEGSEEIIFIDCANETPIGRRSICYDDAALKSRKKFPPEDSAINLAQKMGVRLLTEAEYKQLQAIEAVDMKTSSWLYTPDSIRTLGGAIFGDRRYNHVFIYHNGADSYYKVRGFRGLLQL